MPRIFTVSLFGHRKIENLRQINDSLAPIVKDLIEKNDSISFLIGRNGEFDEYAASILKRVQKETESDTCDIILVLPYRVANLEYYEKYYDSIVLPEKVHGAHPKIAITLKNRWMVEQSDLVIVYVEHNKGGAYTAMTYAQKQGKHVLNLFSPDACPR